MNVACPGLDPPERPLYLPWLPLGLVWVVGGPLAVRGDPRALGVPSAIVFAATNQATFDEFVCGSVVAYLTIR